ncbi:hypothetical protein ACF0H5_009585 [Mactra antiquata]
MQRMSTVDGLDAHKNHTTRNTDEKVGFPSITKKDQNKKRMFVRRTKTFSVRVPPTGHEYDYRRTPDGTGRTTPRMIRPCVPPDTLGLERLHLNDSPVISKHRSKVKLDIGQYPTPVPSESDYYDYNKPVDISAPLPTARSAWDKTNVCTAGDDDLADVTNGLELTNPLPAETFEVKDSHGRRLKGAKQKNTYDVIVSDVDNEHQNLDLDQHCGSLTENALYMHNNRPINRDKRIAMWLADINDQKCNQVPAHLPEISATRKYTMLTMEDV